MSSKKEALSKCMKFFNNDELASNVIVDKYLVRSKKDREDFLETEPKELFLRLRNEFKRIEQEKYNEYNAWEDFDQINFDKIVPQGSILYGLGNNENLSSLSNCVVVASPEDNMSSIMETAKSLANLFKRRAGVGLDLSNLRPDGGAVNNSAGTSTGAWSFADLYSNISRMIGQNGRRSALMITLDVNHPDIEKFITCKLDKTKVTGANISVKVTDKFMKAVENDEDFELCFPTNSNNVVKTVRAKFLWDLIAETNRKSAEPGVIFWDTITKYLPANEYSEFKTICTNPCSEIALSAYDSCRLISLNISKFVENKEFNWKEFEKTCRIMTRLGDDLVDLEIEKLNQIIDKTDEQAERELWVKLRDNGFLGRRIGLGTHGLADCLANLELKYDTQDSLDFAEKLYEQFRNNIYDESCELAKTRGCFPAFDKDKHLANAYIQKLPKSILDKIKETGIRNISLLTQAPTGSISIVSQTSSGIEPVFMNFYTRRKKKNHQSIPSDTDFIDQNGDRWEEFTVYHKNVKDWIQNNPNKEVPDYFVEAHKVDWKFRVRLQGIIQQFIDHSISSTINLPVGTSSETIQNIYFEAWKNGLKGITVYVDGSRTGVLVSNDTKKEFDFNPKDAPKRPVELECDIHTVSVKGDKYTFFVGLLNGNPYEVMGGKSEFVEIPDKFTKAKIVKYHKNKETSRYDLLIDDIRINNLTKIFENKNNEVLTRMISLALRHGSSPSFLVEQLSKDPESDFFSFSRGISRVLKKYIKDGTKVTTDKTCPSCNTEGMKYVEGCATCVNCGYSKCN